ncbi:MAG TPA: hypothetical protein VMH89_06685 [Candidatus Acidoferrum sp.]|nr:hypothetical protein [Candidatus Acidoferrum sp.]
MQFWRLTENSSAMVPGFQGKIEMGRGDWTSGGRLLKKECIFEGVPFALAEEMLREAGTIRVEARGESMLPAIFPGEELILHRVRLRDVSVGDVVLFVQKGKWHLERVQEILPGIAQPYLRTGLDMGSSREEPVFGEELLGRVVFVIRDCEEMVLSRKPSFGQLILGTVLKNVPAATLAFLAWRQLRSRIANFRQGAENALAGSIGHNI